jgi:hypothetical protein
MPTRQEAFDDFESLVADVIEARRADFPPLTHPTVPITLDERRQGMDLIHAIRADVAKQYPELYAAAYAAPEPTLELKTKKGFGPFPAGVEVVDTRERLFARFPHIFGAYKK